MSSEGERDPDYEEVLEYCTITVDGGDASATYKWSHLDVEGGFSHDEDVSDWSNDELLDLFSVMIGFDKEDDCDAVTINRL